jgi:hypothetical protein
MVETVAPMMRSGDFEYKRNPENDPSENDLLGFARLPVRYDLRAEQCNSPLELDESVYTGCSNEAPDLYEAPAGR